MKQILIGEKELLQLHKVVWVKEVINFKELTIEALLTVYPKWQEAKRFIPDLKDLKRLDKVYFLNVR